ncbi:hypothetical protein GWK47_029592 [Chionoecetes opilio]|uniref:Uncharacterized protein n=1 Tax=Chionoecetes opilio TaxID=41210 RepID=A0A8J4YKJ7_CHIOP|nr:hypothetical protein GWK47_029592 [Chionoecetes opilio]
MSCPSSSRSAKGGASASLQALTLPSLHNAARGGGTLCPATMPNCPGQCYHSPHVKLRRFNEFASLGIQALEDIHMRAQYELFGDVLLMTNGIKNSLKVNPSGQPSDGPMGISVALTPSTTTNTPLSKTFITNASFRTKKLPDDLLESTGEEEDPFALDRYVEVIRDPTFGHTTQHTQGHTHTPGTASASASRHTPQMGVTALKMIPESKVLKTPESRRSAEPGGRPSSARRDSGGSPSPKGLLDLHHLGRRHKRSGESPGMSPRLGREGAQSPKGIRLDLHLTRKHKRSSSGSQTQAEAQHGKAGDSPNLSCRPASARVEGAPPKGNFLDIHINHRHKRSSSGGQGTGDFVPDKFGDSPAISSEQLPRDSSPTSDKRFISFLKTHIPFVGSQAQSAGPSPRAPACPSPAPEEAAPDAPAKGVATRHQGHIRHYSDCGQTAASLQQSAPATPSKAHNRHSADLSGHALRHHTVVVDGNRLQERLWEL